MTNAQIEALNLGLPNNATTWLIIESALNWVLENTTLKFDIANVEELKALPAQVRLFALKYNEIMSISEGVASESIEGLSLSFNASNKAGMIWELAENLLGKWLVSPVQFVSSVSRWSNED